MKVLILLCAIGAAFAAEVCQDNAHFESCGSACPLTCENYSNPPKVCVLMCVSECVCDEGYVKAIDGRCVRPENCPAIDPPEQMNNPSCPANSHYDSCGTMCEITCDNYQDPPVFCNRMCNPGCHCDEGYVKDVNGNCIKPESCPAAPAMADVACPANSHYESCGTACPLTCENYNDPPQACVLMCNPGCHCDEGYVKTHDGNCIQPEHCPARDPPACDENSHYLECGTACPLTCENYDNPPKICPAMCVSGCHCMKGYVKTDDGHCVLPENCPSHAVRPEEPSCFGEPDTGNCRAYIPMYYYDIKDATCKKFIYGGCNGNGNRYVTEKECLAQCEGVQERSSSTCELPAETGVCRGFFPRYYFDAVREECREFVYGGCGGNENNFETAEKCQEACGKQSASCPANSHYESCGTMCEVTCENYHDPPTFCVLMCNPGCHCDEGYVKDTHGNCIKPESCPSYAPLMAFDASDCQKTPETGPCHGNFYRYYFDRTNKMCKPFIYGGCQGNGNNFESEEECNQKCGASFAASACDQEKVVGPCRAYFPRYFFNKQSGQCERFIYGGCQGNDNNYLTQDECESECVA